MADRARVSCRCPPGLKPRRAMTGRVMKRIATLVLSVFVLLGFGSRATAQTTAAQCSGLTKLQVPGYAALEITKAEWIAPAAAPTAAGPGRAGAANLPPYCRIDGMIDRR